ncbi:unnamed protein product [Gongylonema pulchrum]|uniref:Uncharacterized protein n=1 Tax=Gongylonema pulchrum TaxID=637853 RepID=A0A183EBX7_9BILA|nr:unnamed protein product [Gongylonema pulchrum]
MTGTVATAEVTSLQSSIFPCPVSAESAPIQHKNTISVDLLCDEVFDEALASVLRKMKREWRCYGWYTSCDEMNEVRKQEKVSKRKSVTQANGIKVITKYWGFPCRTFYPTRTPVEERSCVGTENLDNTSVRACEQQQVLTQFVINATVDSQGLFGVEQGTAGTEWVIKSSNNSC